MNSFAQVLELRQLVGASTMSKGVSSHSVLTKGASVEVGLAMDLASDDGAGGGRCRGGGRQEEESHREGRQKQSRGQEEKKVGLVVPYHSCYYSWTN